MASKRRQRRKECERKVRFATHDAAFSFKMRNGCHDHEPYHCPRCGGYHLGHIPGWYGNNFNKRVFQGAPGSRG